MLLEAVTRWVDGATRGMIYVATDAEGILSSLMRFVAAAVTVNNVAKELALKEN